MPRPGRRSGGISLLLAGGVVVCLAYALIVASTNLSAPPPRAVVLPTPTPEPPALARRPVRGAIDVPDEQAEVFTSLVLRGWALDAADPVGPGVDRVEVLLDGTAVADATPGLPRPDVAEQFGPGFLDSGWTATVDLRTTPTGPHQVTVRAHSPADDSWLSLLRTVRVVRAPAVPRGAIDTPAEGEAVSGMVDLRGWAIDAAAADGTSGIDRVQLILDGVSLAPARYGLPREDVASSYGAAFGAAGWQADVDTTALAAGPHTLEVQAYSSFTGVPTSYQRTILVAGPDATNRTT